MVIIFGNFIKILFLSFKSHLLDEKKYKFFTSSYESLESSIMSLNFKNSAISGLPKIKGKLSLAKLFLDSFPLDPTRNI